MYTSVRCAMDQEGLRYGNCSVRRIHHPYWIPETKPYYSQVFDAQLSNVAIIANNNKIIHFIIFGEIIFPPLEPASLLLT